MNEGNIMDLLLGNVVENWLWMTKIYLEKVNGNARMASNKTEKKSNTNLNVKKTVCYKGFSKACCTFL